eukprot:gnl/TRDRNA2_/TRDRNA2_36783_c0_seq1.p1 gnl/TRDRNA2_/TRDRNA2_36783_c0~~gnl/TRDRNA2_/TRDRNA2_36783_c0_seq1.p1  ORF type:complete len:1061 (-),score=248.96 gnl/TRDRNA2_/TRDRNA2_36783_c0_seq1:71-3253(-)
MRSHFRLPLRKGVASRAATSLLGSLLLLGVVVESSWLGGPRVNSTIEAKGLVSELFDRSHKASAASGGLDATTLSKPSHLVAPSTKAQALGALAPPRTFSSAQPRAHPHFFREVETPALFMKDLEALQTSRATKVEAFQQPAQALAPLPQLQGSVAGLRGGKCAAVLAHVAATATAEATGMVEKFRKDYKAPPYRIDSVSLNFDIREGETLVSSSLKILPEDPAVGSSCKTLDLDGEDLVLKSIFLDGSPLSEGTDYVLTPTGLSLINLPAGEKTFELQTLVAIEPEKNTQLSGLYKSSGMYTTQCEANGFRRITYFQDRPDIMARYEVRIEADKAKYPLLLSNGNEVSKGDSADGRHWASFSDPFRKPSYLFAAVAGDLGGIESSFTTMSGRNVRLYVWSEHENVDQLDWAMESLKKSMKWDEEKYGREYDLDVFHIVAVNDFNMGAMENKGLNIFNTAAVLAKPSTATDADYERVLAIVAHEYFHNWSGNRITCRDWFQLTLKEGLTVFRDQHFSEDVTSAAVRRIEEARIIRSAQFIQDAGPLAHPIRPDSYISMDNFYTVTVYNKGAEVIRMYRTILGAEGFRKGMDLYWERHDGQAVTCDDFRQAMADATGKDLTQFERWYEQAGTPTVTAKWSYDESAKTFTLTLAQSTPATPGQPEKKPFHIPVVVGLLGSDGSLLAERTVELTESEQSFEFTGINEKPLPSLLREFSAPVKLQTSLTPSDLAFLAANDRDPFNRWDASQRLYTSALLELVKSYQDNGGDETKMAPLSSSVIDAFGATLTAADLDPSLRAYSLSLPDFSTLAQEMDVIDVDAITTALKIARKSLAAKYKDELLSIYNSLTNSEPYAIEESQVGKRRLRNTCLAYLSKLKEDDTTKLCLEQFQTATSMTDSFAAVAALSTVPGIARDEALDTFYKRAKENNEALVINKWLSVQAMADTPTALADVKALVSHEGFDANNPNSFRSLIGAFAGGNPAAFHKKDGSGYNFIADQVIEVDKRNPQIASRLASAFNQYKQHDEGRQALMKEQLERIADQATSDDTKEIVNRCLGRVESR